MITKTQINHIKSLKEKNSRMQLSEFVVEGEKMFDEIFNSIFFIKEIFLLKENISNETFSKIKSLSQKNICTINEVSFKEMERLTNLKTATPILAIIETKKHTFDIDIIKNELSLALDNIQDPGNMGTIIRIADWFGIKNIFCSLTSADIYNPKVVQASMGAITRVKIHYLNLDGILNTLKNENVPIYGTFLEGGTIYDCNLSGKSGVIVMGNEGNGISDEVAQIVTDKLFIPPFPAGAQTSESLNVGVATAIICNEFRRK